MSDLQFTDVGAISRRLQGRLDVFNEVGAPPAWKKNDVSRQSNPETVAQIAVQQEAFVRTVLRCVYRFPLQLTEPDTRAVLAEIVEKLVVAELLDVYYLGPGSGMTGSEGSGMAASDRKAAYEKLHLFTAGHGFPLPNIPYVPTGVGQKDQQGVVLPGESLNPKIPDLISRVDTYVGNLPRGEPDDRPLGMSKQSFY